ncbi:MAG: hypothetical protein RSH52_27920, partial [Janthinobacterium sp.]
MRACTVTLPVLPTATFRPWLRGANGAGKTTLLKLAGGALLPARGAIRLNDIDSGFMPLAYRALAFYCGGDAPALPWLQVHEFLD